MIITGATPVLGEIVNAQSVSHGDLALRSTSDEFRHFVTVDAHAQILRQLNRRAGGRGEQIPDDRQTFGVRVEIRLQMERLSVQSSGIRLIAVFFQLLVEEKQFFVDLLRARMSSVVGVELVHHALDLRPRHSGVFDQFLSPETLAETRRTPMIADGRMHIGGENGDRRALVFVQRSVGLEQRLVDGRGQLGIAMDTTGSEKRDVENRGTRVKDFETSNEPMAFVQVTRTPVDIDLDSSSSLASPRTTLTRIFQIFTERLSSGISSKIFWASRTRPP